MTRLTKGVRDKIIDELLLKRFKPQGIDLAKQSERLFLLIYETRYDPDTRRQVNKLKSKFHDAFQHYGTIECLAPGALRITVGNSIFGWGNTRFRGEVEHRPFLAGDRSTNKWTFVDCEIGQQLSAFAASQTSLIADIKATSHEIEGALSTVSTDRQLGELWPEVLPIAKRYMPVEGRRNLPAIQFSKLTQSLGLHPVVAAT